LTGAVDKMDGNIEFPSIFILKFRNIGEKKRGGLADIAGI
jgi:hypothetical protein